MRALLALTVANIRSYLRDRAAVFWTLAFPLIFIFMFGFIFQGGGSSRARPSPGWMPTAPAASTQLHAAFAAAEGLELTDATDRAAAMATMQDGEVDAVIVVPAGYGDAVAAATAGTGAPASLTIVIDPSRQELTASRLPGRRQRPRRRQPRWPAAARRSRCPRPSRPRTCRSSATSCRASSGCRSCSSGIFAAIPLVGRPREGHPQATRRDARSGARSSSARTR